MLNEIHCISVHYQPGIKTQKSFFVIQAVYLRVPCVKNMCQCTAVPAQSCAGYIIYSKDTVVY